MLVPGAEPLLVFYFPKSEVVKNLFQSIGVNVNLGLPIPFYLSPSFGFAWQNDSYSLSLDTQVVPLHPFDPKTGQKIPNAPDKEIAQRGIANNLTINFSCDRDSLLLTALIALSDQILDKVIKSEYQVHYFNGVNLLIGGLLADFSTQTSNDTTKIDCTIVLSRAAKKQTLQLPDIQTVSSVSLPTAQLPGPGNLHL